MYTLREFRANTKQAFDDAAEGHEVVIERNKQTFQLISLVGNPVGKSSFVSQPAAKPRLKEPEEFFETHDYPGIPLSEPIKAIREVAPDWRPCKHGADPKMCKHSKPGKPCK